MTVLFSPIGTADPITILGDGPMLHIVRFEKPEKIVLYLSPKMAAYQRCDQRYTKAVELLSARNGLKAPEMQIIESDIQEVYRFDLYIKEFEPILKQLAMSNGKLLVNTSSGTSGMAQALVALGSFGRLDIELLQVLTPKKDTNSRDDREDPDRYDLNEMWEFDCELEDGAVSRIAAVQTPNFAERLLRENIVSLCNSYEFEAASNLLQKMNTASEKTKQLIEAAAARLNLDGNLPAKVFAGTELSYKANDLLVEYLYVMEARLQQGHYAEFVRSLTPALTQLMKQYLRPYLSDDKYIAKRTGEKRASDKYNVKAIDADEKLARTLKPFRYRTSSFVSNAALMELTNVYCENREAVIKLQRLRYAEEKARNSLAHSLRPSARTTIEGECGISLDAIMDMLFELHGTAEPGLYARIAKAIDDSFDATGA